jgi:hypothetical protein
MNYANGREAKVGDSVIGTCYNTPGVIVGQIVAINPSATTCNCTVLMIGNAAHPIKEDYSQCDRLFHAEDAVVKPVAPPAVDNAHVTEGCEKFSTPAATPGTPT